VLIERTWRNRTFAAIGGLHNCSDEAARKIWARAVRRLRQILAELE
jgi:hypothetical protein